MNTYNLQNPDDHTIEHVEGTFHDHPSATSQSSTTPIVDPLTSGATIGGETTNRAWIQKVSQIDIDDAKNKAGFQSGNSFVVGARNSTVYIYNGSGVQATLPLNKFITIK